ncbi:unnamed protein product, partial [Timema podura]|nr:unnamed protein product [Timema podura]
MGSFRLSSSPRKRRDSSGESCLRTHIPRSASESNLACGSKPATPRRKGTPLSSRHRIHSNAITIIPVLPVSVEQEVARLLASPDLVPPTTPARLVRKSRSMDSLRGARAGTPLQYSESEGPTRSPSPAPSSGVESNSIKDSPMQIDVISGDGTSL